jgi:hypothetical protein
MSTHKKNEICMYCKKGAYLEADFFQQPSIPCRYWTEKIGLRFRNEDRTLGDSIPFTVGACFWCPAYEEDENYDEKWSALAKRKVG